jgi:hypothetical protein
MPFRSLKQARWAHSQTGEKALGGPAKVSEWDSATNFKSLPETTVKTKHVDLGSKGSFQEKPGALHAMLHVPPDQKLTAAQETPKPGDSPLLRRRKASAAGFAAMHRG